MISKKDIDKERVRLAQEEAEARQSRTSEAEGEVTTLIAKENLAGALRHAHKEGILASVPKRVMRDAVELLDTNEADLRVAVATYKHLRCHAKARNAESRLRKAINDRLDSETFDAMTR